ncbi:MAG: hypothetical protein OQK32_02235 [Gammaproteobacteria bacterium]|nr:hypothetical protein [Gammaproteobacteria bacterium]
MAELRDLISRNRAEELDLDVWEHFVIPPYFDHLDLVMARKPRIIIGGRGCGKTMLLRYMSHYSAFSPKRDRVPDNAIEHIGLYWRADTQFCSALKGRGIDDLEWQAAFEHYIALVLSLEFFAALHRVSLSSCSAFSSDEFDSIDLSKLSAFDENMPKDVTEAYQYIEQQLWRLETWVNNPKTMKSPQFIPGVRFLNRLVNLVIAQAQGLNEARFYVYVDEYENLTLHQQKVINTWLKHSESPVIFNVAMKREAFQTRQTLGEESLSYVHDMRHIDLEDLLLDSWSSYQTFAAEILVLELCMSNISSEFPTTVDVLRDDSLLYARREPEYKNKVVEWAKGLFPTPTQKELAELAFSENSVVSKIKSNLEKALKNKKCNLNVDLFFRPELPEATIVTQSLLWRERIDPNNVVKELDKLSEGQKNKYSGSAGWIHNNFIGSLLHTYAPYSKACPFYAGFESFLSLSHGNIRHFLELCNKSINRSIDIHGNVTFPVEISAQAEAARQASADLISEVRTFGRYGEQLHTFLLRLGSIFAESQRRPSQSEPEVTHFSITKGSNVSGSALKILREATKWSVLYEARETKKKDPSNPESYEYVLNPIYAPYFHISYRKRRKLELSSIELNVLVEGTIDQFKEIYKKYRAKWELNTNQSLSLFDVDL